MRIVDGRPAVEPRIPTVFTNIGIGDLFYDERFPESIFIKNSEAYGVDLKDGTDRLFSVNTVIKRVKGHFVVEEIEE